MKPILLAIALALCAMYILTGVYIRFKKRPISGIPFIVGGAIGIVFLLVYSFYRNTVA